MNQHNSTNHHSKEQEKPYLERLQHHFHRLVAQQCKKEPSNTYFNLLVGQHCYACDKVFDSKQKLSSDPKYLIIKLKEGQNTNCTCGAPLFLSVYGTLSYDESTYRYKILPHYVSSIVSKKLLLNLLLNPHYKDRQPWTNAFDVQLQGSEYYFVKRPLNWFYSCATWEEKLIHQREDLLKCLDQLITQSEIPLDQLDQKHLSELHDRLANLRKISPYSDDLGISFNGIDKEGLQFPAYLFLDLDGTSTDKFFRKANPLSPKLSGYLFKFLKELETRKKLKTVVNSGRPLEHLFMMMNDYGLIPLGIASSGNGVFYPSYYSHNFAKGIHFQKSQYRDVLRSLIQTLRLKYNLPLIEYIPNTNSNTELMLIRDYCIDAKDLETLLRKDSSTSAILKNNNIDVKITDGQHDYMHLSVSKYDKAKTAALLMKQLGLKKDQCFNIGNHYNDLVFKEHWDAVYGVLNAEEDYKKACTYVSPYVEAKGTVDCVVHFLKSKNLLTDHQIKQIHQAVVQSYHSQVAYYGNF